MDGVYPYKRILFNRVICTFAALILAFSVIMTATGAWMSTRLTATNIATANPQAYSVQLTKLEKGSSTITIKDAEFYLYKIEDTTETRIGSSYFTGSTGKIEVDNLYAGDYVFREVNPTYSYDYDGGKTDYTFTVGNATAVQNPDGTYKPFEVTAYNQKRVAPLTITKTVAGKGGASLTDAQKAEEFMFSVTIGDGTDTTTGYSFSKNNTAQPGKIHSGDTFTLKHDETVKILGLPVGVGYNIDEAAKTGYSKSSLNDNGDIPQAGITAAFTNTATYDHGTLTVTKTVTGVGADLTKDFEFTATIGGVPYTFLLKDGESKTFTDIPEGTAYSVTEKDYSTDNYTAASTGASGTVVKAGVTAAFTNHFEKTTPGTGKLTIHKQVTGTAGSHTKDFDFTVIFGDGTDTTTAYIYKIDGDTSKTFHSGETITLRHGQNAVFENLPAGIKYEVVEADDPADQYIASATGSTGTITVAGVTAEFTNNKDTEVIEYGSLTVKKDVAGEGADLTREFNFTVIIGTDTHTFKLKNGESKIFNNIPVGTHYTVVEDDPFADSYIRESIDKGEGNIIKGNIHVAQTNTFVGPVFITISGEKVWEHGGNPLENQPTKITVLLKNGETVVSQKEVTAADDWKYTFSVPKYGADGTTPISYTIDEKKVDGYSTAIDGTNITNTFIPFVLVDPPVEKVIQGTPGVSSNFTFEFTSMTANAPMPAGTVDGKKAVTITGAGQSEFGNIRFETPGEYIYKISEVNDGIPGYTYDTTVYTVKITITKPNANTVNSAITYTKQNGSIAAKPVFTNTFTTAQPVTIKVTKVWNDGNNAGRPESVAVQLYKNGSSIGGEKVTLSKDNNWTYTWTGLDGNQTWSVDEPVVPSNYTKKITGNAANGFIITNSKPYTPPPDEEVTLNVRKTWVHGTNPVSKQPSSITLYIKDGNILIAAADISDNTHWQWSIHLPKYRIDGSEAHYTVDEADVPGYTKHVDGYNITNTHSSYIPANEKITVNGSKIWQHGNIAADQRPDSIIVYVKNGNRIVAEKKVTAADGWHYTFQVPKFEEDGKTLVQYTIDEANVPYYTHTINGNNITNTYKSMEYPGDSPKTGDDSNTTLWLVLMFFSLATLIVTIILGKKSKNVGKCAKRYQ